MSEVWQVAQAGGGDVIWFVLTLAFCALVAAGVWQGEHMREAWSRKEAE